MFQRLSVRPSVDIIKSGAVIVALAGLLSLGVVATSSPAAAFTKVKLGTRTKDYIKSLCSQMTGGKYSEGQGQYGCISNCGGQGPTSDACGINCDEKTNECYGWSPATDRKKPDAPAEVFNPPSK